MTEEQKQPQASSAPQEGALPTPEEPQAAPEAQPKASEPPSPEAKPQPSETPKPQPSPWKRRLRRAFWFLALLVVVFLGGFITAVVTIVNPLEASLNQKRREIFELQNQVTTLEKDLQAKEQKIRDLQSQIEKLEQRLKDLEEEHLRALRQAALIQAQRNVYKAVVALHERDTQGARLALTAALEDLTFLQDHAPKDLQPFVEDMVDALEDVKAQLTPTDKTIRRLQRLADNLEDLLDLLER